MHLIHGFESELGQIDLQLFVKVVAILFVNESVTKDPEYLMIPEFGDGVLGVTVLEAGIADSLKDFGNVSQVESVMRLFGSG
jgi:hypothetical protein